MWQRFVTGGVGPSLTLAEAAAALGVSVGTVRRLIGQGKLEASKTASGRLRVSPTLSPPKPAGEGPELAIVWQEVANLSVRLQKIRAERDGLHAEVVRLRAELTALKERKAKATLLDFARSDLAPSADGHAGIQGLVVAARRKSRRRLWLWRLSA